MARYCRCKTPIYSKNTGDCKGCEGLTHLSSKRLTIGSKSRKEGTCLWCGSNYTPCSCNGNSITIISKVRKR